MSWAGYYAKAVLAPSTFNTCTLHPCSWQQGKQECLSLTRATRLQHHKYIWYASQSGWIRDHLCRSVLQNHISTAESVGHHARPTDAVLYVRCVSSINPVKFFPSVIGAAWKNQLSDETAAAQRTRTRCFSCKKKKVLIYNELHSSVHRINTSDGFIGRFNNSSF